jgi:hypothetical protein
MTKLEEVARAILVKWSEPSTADCETIEQIASLLARAAVEALREPSEAQYDALCASDKPWRMLTSRMVWTIYIDAILNEREAS